MQVFNKSARKRTRQRTETPDSREEAGRLSPQEAEALSPQEAGRLSPEAVAGEEWGAWYRLTPQERWRESQKLWALYLSLGGTLDPEPDTQSPFFDASEWRAGAADGRAGVRVLRRGGV